MHAALAEHLLKAPDRIDELSEHPIPVPVAYGVDDDVWPLEEQDLMAKRLRANVSRIHGAGHSPAIDDPEATATTLLRLRSSTRTIRALRRPRSV